RLDRPRAEVAAARVRDGEPLAQVQERTEEQQDAPRTPGRRLVHALEIQLGGRNDLEGVRGPAAFRLQPAGADPDAGPYLEDPAALLDLCTVAQRRLALVQQRRAQQSDTRVLAGLDVDAARQLRTAGHPQVHRPGLPE